MAGYLERLQAEVTGVIRGMTSDDLLRHAEGKWSAAEVLEHLHLTYTGTTKGLERCLAAGGSIATRSTWKQFCFRIVVVSLGHMPNGREAPERVRPRGMDLDLLFADIGPSIHKMDEVIRQCELLYGVQTRILDHPILGPLTGRQWRKFHWVHGRHHLTQILRLKESAGSLQADRVARH